MAATPVLSICVPSRNRQYYFQQTIMALAASLRHDVEFVFVDNSDDPTIMNDFIQPYLADPRIRYVPSGTQVRPMMENWEVAIAATTGRWITVIGDDDYADPEIAGVITRIEAQAPDVEALDWTKLYYTWPHDGKPVLSNPVQMQDEVHEVPKASLLKRAFGWENARDVLGSGFGIYHGAISRVLLERIQALGGGRTFEHPIIDYDNIFKVIMHGRRFVYCRRPLSIQGVCPASNSAAATDPEAQRRKQDAFDREHKSPVDAMECYRDFPFHSRLGLVSCILMTQHWFGQKYGHAFSGHEKNVVNSAMIQCGKIQDRVEFDRIANGYRQAFRAWHRGKYLPLFKPVYAPQKPGPIYRGYLNNAIFMTDDHPAFDTIASFYGVASSMLTPVRDLSVDLGRFSVVERPRKQA